MAKKRAQKVDRSRRITFLVCLVAALVGAAFSIELLLVHRQAHAMGTGYAICDFGEGIGCSNVALDEWAKVLGVPTAAWALLTYVAFAGLAFTGVRPRAFKRGPGGLLLWASVPALCFGLFLVYVMVTEIGELCLFCLGLDAVNLVMLVCGLVAVRGRGAVAALKEDLAVLTEHRQVGVAVVAGPLLAGGIVLVFYPRDVEAPPTPRGPEGLPILPDAGWHREPIRTEGVPCIGPSKATVQVFEFSDYQCPHCRRAHSEVRRVVARFEDDVRFCHFHHPLDMACNPRLTRPFHESACVAASAAICAQSQDQFWEMNNLLFRNGRSLNEELVHRLARSLDLDMERFSSCLTSDETRERIEGELAESLEVPVEGTPTFLVNGRVLVGGVPGDDLEVILQYLIDHEGRWPASASPGESP